MMKSNNFSLGESVPLPPGYELVPPTSIKDGHRNEGISTNNPSRDPMEVPEDEECPSECNGILVPVYFKNHGIYTRKEVVDINLMDALDRAGYEVEDVKAPFWSQVGYCFKGVLVDNIFPDTSDPVKRYDDESGILTECLVNNPSMSKNIFIPLTDIDYDCSPYGIKAYTTSVGCGFYFLSESGMLDRTYERFTFKGDLKRDGEQMLVSAQVNSNCPSIFRITGVLLKFSTPDDTKIKRKGEKPKRIGKRLREAVIMAAMMRQRMNQLAYYNNYR